MYKGQTITVIIPCLNEEQGIEKVLRRMPEFVDQVIVVDNGSTDRTSDVARSLGRGGDSRRGARLRARLQKGLLLRHRRASSSRSTATTAIRLTRSRTCSRRSCTWKSTS